VRPYTPFDGGASDAQYDPERHHRHTVRLPDFDYQQEGAYFITLCAYQRETLFGEIVDDDMILNTYGHIVLDEWMEMAIIRPSIFLDECIVMPNHFHAILFLPHIVDAHDVVGAHCRAPSARGINLSRTPQSLGSLIAGFKSTVTKQINILRASPGTPVWQRNFHEHVVRDEAASQRIREYIDGNPATWATDDEHLTRIGHTMM